MVRRTDTGPGLAALTGRREATRRSTVIASVVLFAAFLGGIGGAVLTQREPADTAEAEEQLVFVDPSRSPSPDPDAPLTDDDRAAGLVSLDPASVASGVYLVVPGTEPAPNLAAPTKTVRVEVEQGLTIDADAFATFVMETINEPRSWGKDGAVSFARVIDAPDMRIVLATPATVEDVCAPLTAEGAYACTRFGTTYVGFDSWVEGAEMLGDPATYRRYVINHEVGHQLGRQHVGCPGEGKLAPLMQQQTVEVAPCVPNGWPYPEATADDPADGDADSKDASGPAGDDAAA